MTERAAPRPKTVNRRRAAPRPPQLLPDRLLDGIAAVSRPPRAGWLVVARKELADHLLSARFIVLLAILALAVAVPLYLASARIRELAPQASGDPALFLALFIVGSQDYQILRLDILVSFLAPLLGIAFGFDSVNGERSEGTLPRLLAQPIHRDDVINGKFAAGLVVIALVFLALTALVAGFGIFRLGVIPTSSEILRIVAWLVVTIIYVGFWLAFGTLLSVVFRRAATSALVGVGSWLGITFFGTLITSLVAGVLAPLGANPSVDEALRNAQLSDFLGRLLPSTQYGEVTAVILNPSQTHVGVPVTIGQIQQAQQQIPTFFSLDQSLLLVWPQVVALLALTVVLFAGAYVLFMRQEVRA
ncbi:MAG TPA: ABC transporter permease [Candidatus Limnocylindrales bacterium]